MQIKNIFVNQIGYFLDGSKFAFAMGLEKDKAGADSFEICDCSTGNPLYSGKLVKNKELDPKVGQDVWLADFSDFSKEGQFFVKVGKSKSFDFKIADHVYDSLYFSTLNYFKLSRCGQGICHTSPAEIYGTDQTKNVQGGWHDAGDYGRYVVAAAKTVMDLLLAYDSTKDKFSDFDILDEVRFELEWMLQMQRKDGGVYHKITCYHFCAFILPEEEKDKQVLAPVSTAATADFAGCLAFAAKYYEKTDPDFAKNLLEAAKKAQSYLDNHDDELFINPPEITTGGYGDKNVADERYFALCSLWAATGDESYLNRAAKIRLVQKLRTLDPSCPWDRGWHEGFGWGVVSGYGSEILLENADKIKDPQFLSAIKTDLFAQADEILKLVGNSAFKICLEHFGWGSNGAICDIAHLLLLAFEVSGNSDYLTAAGHQFDYLLGCNPLNYCYVTGEGSHFPEKPHHRPSGASGHLMPGMLVGGPSEWLQDECAKKYLQGKAPLMCFIDKQGSYSTNEVAIYWNSAFVHLLAKVGIGRVR